MASVLVVDGHPDSCEDLMQFLARGNHAVRCVANGRDALAAIGALLPDFILVDAQMPVMDGITLIEVIRSYLRWSSIPIAVMTAYPEENRLSRLAHLGVRRVFRKADFTFDDLAGWMSLAALPTTPAQTFSPCVNR